MFTATASGSYCWLDTAVDSRPTSLAREWGSLHLSEPGYDGISDIVCQRAPVWHLIAGQNALQLRHLRVVALLLLLLCSL